MKYTISARIKKDDMLKHFLALGGSGSGKTTLALGMFYDMARTSNKQKLPDSLIFLEPHGDASLKAGLIRIIPRERLVFISNTISRLAETDTKWTFTFNPFENDGSEEMRYYLRNELTGAITELLESSHHSTPIGLSVQMATILSNAIAVTLATDAPNILTLLKMFGANNEELISFGCNYPHPQVADFFRYQFMSDAYKQTRASILTKLSYFLNDTYVYQVLGSTISTLKLDQFIDEGKIIIIHNPKGVSANVQSFIGRLIVARVFSAMLRREAMKQEDRRRCFVFIDEFQSYITSSLASSLQEARKYNMGLLLFTQSLKQIQDTRTSQSIITNTYWKVCGVIDADNVISYGKNFGDAAAKIPFLRPLQFLIKKMGNSEAFTFTTSILPRDLFYTDSEAKELYRELIEKSGLYVQVKPPTLTPPPPPLKVSKSKASKAQKENGNPFEGNNPAF